MTRWCLFVAVAASAGACSKAALARVLRSAMVQSLRELVRQSLPVMFTPVEESPGSIGQGDG